MLQWALNGMSHAMSCVWVWTPLLRAPASVLSHPCAPAPAALQVYRQLLEPGSSSSRTISEKGVLQLLLDVRLLRDMLAGGRPHNPNSALPTAAAQHVPSSTGRASLPSLFDQDPEVVNALAARKREASGLETMLQDRWAACLACVCCGAAFDVGMLCTQCCWLLLQLQLLHLAAQHCHVCTRCCSTLQLLHLLACMLPAPAVLTSACCVPPRRLDPIDWATYEPYLWSNTQKYYQRVAVLLGTLIQLHRVHPEAPGRWAHTALRALGWAAACTTLHCPQRTSCDHSTWSSRQCLMGVPVGKHLLTKHPSHSCSCMTHMPDSSSLPHHTRSCQHLAHARPVPLSPPPSSLTPTSTLPHRSFTTQDSNPLNVLNVAPRFQYLPISAPTTSAAAGAKTKPALSGGLQRTASGMVPAPAAAATASHTSDLAANYSFADLGLGRASNAAGSSDQGAGDAYGVGSSALSAIQARLQGGGLGTLGLMLGDKAAEMTAMAQQRFETFGDYLPTAGLGTGLLSSFTKSVSTKK
jgi:hypothetical protein